MRLTPPDFWALNEGTVPMTMPGWDDKLPAAMLVECGAVICE